MAGNDASGILLLDSDLMVHETTPLAPATFGDSKLLAASFGRDGASFYVADSGPGGGRISLVRKSDGLVLETRKYPHEMTPGMLTVTPDSRTLIVGGRSANGAAGGVVSLLSAHSLSEWISIEPCAGSPDHVTVFPELNRAYLRCEDVGAVVADIDLELRRVVRTAVLDDSGGQTDSQCGPGGIALSPSGGFVLVPCATSGLLLYLDRLRLEVLDSATVGVGVFHIAVAPRDPIALITLPDSQAIAFVDLRSRQVTTRLLTPGRPRSIAISGDGSIAYVLVARSGPDSAAVVRVDVASEQILSTVAVPAGSRFLSLWPGSQSPTMRWR